MSWLILIPVFIYSLILLLIYRGLFRKSPGTGNGFHQTKIAVIVPCKNEARNIAYLLNDLLLQDYPPDLFEIIVVDDNSDDNTVAVATEYLSKGRIRILKNTASGKKSAIRTGITGSDARLILTTDADCRIGRKWISSIESFYGQNQTDLIIGPVQIEGGKGVFKCFQELEFMSLQGITAATAGIDRPVMCNGANLAFTREIYNKYSDDLRDEIFSGDDIFLLQAVRKGKGKIGWTGERNSVVITSSPCSVSCFLRQRARWISKSGYYSDRFAQVLALITLLANAAMAFLAVSMFLIPGIMYYYLAAFMVKSVPDLLILSVMTARYEKTNLLWWFIPLQVIYPFYVIMVSLYSLFRRNRW